MQADAGAEHVMTHVPLLHVLPPLQSAFDKHSTHDDIVPWTLQNGVVPLHGLHVAPHAAAVVHCAHAPPTHW